MKRIIATLSTLLVAVGIQAQTGTDAVSFTVEECSPTEAPGARNACEVLNDGGWQGRYSFGEEALTIASTSNGQTFEMAYADIGGATYREHAFAGTRKLKRWVEVNHKASVQRWTIELNSGDYETFWERLRAVMKVEIPAD